jgi:hypothetical protein
MHGLRVRRLLKFEAKALTLAGLLLCFGSGRANTPIMVEGKPLEIGDGILFPDFKQDGVPVRTLPVLMRNQAARGDMILSQVFFYPALGLTLNGIAWSAYASTRPLTGEKLDKSMLYFGLGSFAIGALSWFPFRHYENRAADRYNQSLGSRLGFGLKADPRGISFALSGWLP